MKEPMNKAKRECKCVYPTVCEGEKCQKCLKLIPKPLIAECECKEPIEGSLGAYLPKGEVKYGCVKCGKEIKSPKNKPNNTLTTKG